MFIIRNDIFETNSSSAHALVINHDNNTHVSREKLIEAFPLNDEGYWKLEDNYYGRAPFDILSAPDEKARYFIAAHCRDINDDCFVELEEYLKNTIPGCKGVELSVTTGWSSYDKKSKATAALKEYKSEYPRYDSNKLKVRKKWNGWGHDEYTFGSTDSYNFKSPCDIVEFITNKKYIIVVDGDEYCIWSSLCSAGLIKGDIADIDI